MGVLQILVPLVQVGVASLLIDQLLTLAFDFLVEALGLFEVEGKLSLEFKDAPFILREGIDFGDELIIVLED